MIFTKASEYGIKAAVYIAQQSIANKRVGLKTIATEIDSPEAFTAKILQTLVKDRIVKSTQGPTGGFHIDTETLSNVRLLDIVISLEGPIKNNACVLGLKECSVTNPCPIHHKFKAINKELLTMLRETTLDEMSKSVINGLSFLKASYTETLICD